MSCCCLQPKWRPWWLKERPCWPWWLKERFWWLKEMACLLYFPSLAPLPYRPKHFHFGTEGDHHAFFGLLAFLPLLGCLAPYRPKTFSFKYRKRNLLMLAYLVNIGLQGTNTPHRPKLFILVQKETTMPYLACLPSFPWFLPLLPSPTDQNVFILVQKETIIPSLACLPSNICLMANFDSLGYQGFQCL